MNNKTIIGITLLALFAGLLFGWLVLATHTTETITLHEYEEVIVEKVTYVPVNHYITQCTPLKTPIESSDKWDAKVEENDIKLYSNYPSECAKAHNRSAC